MKYFGMVLFVAVLLVASVGVADADRRPLSPAEVAAGRIHDAARAGCLGALSADHRVKAMAIIADFNAGKITLDAAGEAVAELLSNDEVEAISDQHQAMIDSFHDQEVQSHQLAPSLVKMPPRPIGREQAGNFFVQFVGDVGVVFAQMTPLPLPSASPN